MPSFEFIANFEKDTLAPQIKSSIFDKNLHLVFEEPIKLLSEDIFFYNNSPLGPSNMSVLFTEKIKDYFERNTSLKISILPIS